MSACRCVCALWADSHGTTIDFCVTKHVTTIVEYARGRKQPRYERFSQLPQLSFIEFISLTCIIHVLGQSGSIEKLSRRRKNVRSETTLWVAAIIVKTKCIRLDCQNPLNDRDGHTGNRSIKPLPVCCSHGLFCLESTAVDAHLRNPSSKHVDGSLTFTRWEHNLHYYVGWCWSSCFRSFADVVAQSCTCLFSSGSRRVELGFSMNYDCLYC